jgi:uncharacterized protein YndB with AHSA1/START domain
MTSTDASRAPTVSAPTYYEGPGAVDGDVQLRIRCFTYQTDAGLVAGRNTSEIFTIDRPAKDVWPVVSDFNLWHNVSNYFYSGVVRELYTSAERDLGTGTFQITVKKTGEPGLVTDDYVVLKVVPEHLIVLFQPVPEDGSNGGISPGFHVITLNENDGKTVVTFYTEHASRTTDQTVEEALAPYREGADETLRRFRDDFIPTLKRLVYNR